MKQQDTNPNPIARLREAKFKNYFEEVVPCDDCSGTGLVKAAREELGDG